VTETGSESTAAKAFVIMPFASEFDDVYDAIKRAVSRVDAGLHLSRLDELRSAGRISDDLIRELTSCSLCIADVSGANANVMWEVGYAAALKKPVIALNQSSSPLPFDIADVRTVMYDRASLSKNSPRGTRRRNIGDPQAIFRGQLSSQSAPSCDTATISGRHRDHVVPTGQGFSATRTRAQAIPWTGHRLALWELWRY